ncbi:MAG TPA: helix-turn-helix domain-containing protein [Candidatus Paceibacterota bacterium]|nr:helix-turn-helix domain-containing protein [Candidatus Paceibacterota bacterium]
MFRTKAQQRAHCGTCPVARVADLVGDSWSILILRDLLEGPRRFGDLEESLHGISSRTLAKKLKSLEEHKMITRTEHREKPPRVEYELTDAGHAFHSIIDAMRAFGSQYLPAA